MVRKQPSCSICDPTKQRLPWMLHHKFSKKKSCPCPHADKTLDQQRQLEINAKKSAKSRSGGEHTRKKAKSPKNRSGGEHTRKTPRSSRSPATAAASPVVTSAGSTSGTCPMPVAGSCSTPVDLSPALYSAEQWARVPQGSHDDHERALTAMAHARPHTARVWHWLVREACGLQNCHCTCRVVCFGGLDGTGGGALAKQPECE